MNMDLEKVLWCESCGRIDIGNESGICPGCGKAMGEIGFVDDGLESYKTDKPGIKNLGGSVKPGYCKCGQPRASKGIDEYGRRRYRTECYKCMYQKRLLVKSTKCRICGIKPENKADLHIDHIDGNRSNNSNSNIQTLCVDCHKYKTAKQKDWKKKI